MTIENIDGKNVAFHNLPESAFPFTVEFFNAGKEVVHTIVVDGPGGFVVPGLAQEHGHCTVKITYADGMIVTDG